MHRVDLPPTALMLACTELLYTRLASREAKRAARILWRRLSCTACIQLLRSPEVQHRAEQMRRRCADRPRPHRAVRDKHPGSGRRAERRHTTEHECEVPALQRLLDESQLHCRQLEWRSSVCALVRPNVRVKRATTAGRQARAGENVPRTARPGLVACRWRSA